MEAKNNDEIDLISLLTKVSIAIKRNLGLILLLGTLGLIAGFSITVLSKNMYESKMLVSSEILTFSYAEKLVNTLNELLREKDKTYVSKRLGISEQQAKRFNHIKVETAVSEQIALPENQKNYLLLTVRVSDLALLDTLQRSLTKYLEDNDFVKIRVRQKKEYFKQLVQDTDDEIKSLEELKAKIYSGDFLEKAKGNLMFDPTTVNSKIIDLKKEKMQYQNSLELVNSIHVVEGFTPFSKPINNRKVMSTFVGGLIGTILALLIIGIKALNRTIKENESSVA